MARRFGALFIDWMVALLTVAAITRAPVYGGDQNHPLLPLLVFFVEVALQTGLLGFTIGKRLLGLRVEGHDGGRIGVLRAMIRTALLCLVVPPIVMTEDKRGLHDLAANSRVARR